MVGDTIGVVSAMMGFIGILGLFCSMYALAEVSRVRSSLGRFDERFAHAKSMAHAAAVEAGESKRHALSAMTEASRALTKADMAHVEVEAARKATHTIQMVPVDDIADKSLNHGLEGLDEVSFDNIDGIHDQGEPLS